MADSHRPAKKSKFSGGFVTIRAGTGDGIEEFHVHEDVIKAQSEYFRAAFDAKWQEGKTRMMELPEDDPAVVATYVEWSYSRSITVPRLKDLRTSAERDDSLQHLLRLPVFGEKIQNDAFCDDALGAVLQFCNNEDAQGRHWYPTKEDIAIIYDGTLEGSPARKLMVHMHVHLGTDAWIGDNTEHNHPEFLVDLCKALMNRVGELDQRRTYNAAVYEMRDQWIKACNK